MEEVVIAAMGKGSRGLFAVVLYGWNNGIWEIICVCGSI